MIVLTTINPYSNFDAQNEAMLSWSLKHNVYSVNTKEEILINKELYPYINFIETEDTFDYKDKKLIKLNALLNSANKLESDYFCIINSDIILNSDKELSIKKYNDGLIIGTRWELDGDKKYPFNKGYDLFIFNKNLIKLFTNKNYVIGMPWWDFWIPTVTIKAGINVYHIKNQLIYHRTHETNYNDSIWIDFGKYFYNDIMINLMNNNISTNIYDFSASVKFFIEKNQKNIKI